MAIDIPVQDPVRLTSTASTDVYEAPSTPSTTKVSGLRLSFMHDGTSTTAVGIAIHHLSTNGTYGSDTQVDYVTVSQNRRETSKILRLAAGGKIVCAADQADQITVDLDSGVIFS
jgi:hypothetical protein